MRYLLYTYIIFFALFSVWMVVDSVIGRKALRDVLAEGLLQLVTVIGTLLYLFQAPNELLVHAWKVVSIVLVVAFLWLNLRDRFDVLSGRDEEFRDKPPSTRAVLATDLSTAAILLPALVLNVLYGYA